MESPLMTYSGRPKRIKDFPGYAPRIENRKYSVMSEDHLYVFVKDPHNPLMRSKPRDVKFIGLMMAVVDDGADEPLEDDYKRLELFSRVYIQIECAKYKGQRIYLKAFYISEDGHEGKISRPYSFLIR